MTARISSLGGLFSRLTVPASLTDPTHFLTLVSPPSIWTLPYWFATAWLGARRGNPWLHTLPVAAFRALPAHPDDEDVHVQVDGDWLCRLPVEVRLVPDAVSMLMPAENQTKT
jgi:diacylglycerol kinase family enzyme